MERGDIGGDEVPEADVRQHEERPGDGDPERELVHPVEHGAEEDRACPARAARSPAAPAWRLVISAPTTNTTPVAGGRDRRVGHRHHRRRVDDDPLEVLLQRLDEVAEPLRAEQFRGVRRRPCRPSAATAPARRLADGRWPSRHAHQQVRQPRLLRLAPNMPRARAAGACRRRSAAPAGRSARATIARFAATIVLPSPGPVLVTTRRARALLGRREEHVGPHRAERLREVRRHAVADERGRPFQFFGFSAGTIPSVRQPEVALISSGVLIRLSTYSKKNARPTPPGCPAEERQQQVQRRAAATPGDRAGARRRRRPGCCSSSARC
jgi:hypothetical protein